MKKALFLKLKEALISVLPVTLIVLLLNCTPLLHFSSRELFIFSVSSVFLIVGIGLFSLGADVAMTPMGEHVGSGLTKSKNLLLLVAVCFIMGVLITVAEPDLTVLASQVAGIIDSTVLIFTVGIGVGLFLVIAILKIVFKKSLASILMFFYMVMFALSALVIINGNIGFLPMAYDSGGVTTGPITVPFIMALGVGIAATIGGKNAEENSFGLVALCSIGPILAVILLGIGASGTLDYQIPDYAIADHFLAATLHLLVHTAKEVLLALGLIVVFFAVLQVIRRFNRNRFTCRRCRRVFTPDYCN